MIKVRRNCFETNSSSTHSISIERLSNNSFKYINIPKNKNIYIYKIEFNEYGDNETEWTKLNALIDFVIGYYSENDIFKAEDYNIARRVDIEKPLFSIIQKLIKNECNSEITFPFYNNYCYKTDYDEKNSLSILGLDDESTEEILFLMKKSISAIEKMNINNKKDI